MEKPRRASRVALVSLIGAVVAGCGGIGNVSGDSQVPLATSTVAAPQSGRHLYVAQGFYSESAVYRFPLRADGLPYKKPDGELKLGFPFPGSIAIGPDGDLYVSSDGDANGCKKRKCYVAVFAPGASGKAKPIRVLYVPQTPVFLALDQRGYLDVSTHPGWQHPVTNVYLPNAKGNDAPIREISTIGNNALGASRGIVYIQTVATNEGVEAVSETSSSPPPLYYTYGNNYAADGVATDGAHLYAQYFWFEHSQYELATAVFRIGQPGPAIRSIVGTGCAEGFSSGGALGYGLAVYKKYLYEGCIGGGGSAGVVLVYDKTKSGSQSPIESLPGGDTGVAIGP